jgi:hypothetical protein
MYSDRSNGMLTGGANEMSESAIMKEPENQRILGCVSGECGSG